MTDVDVDGAHITRCFNSFFRQMPELIEEGHIYMRIAFI